LWVVVVGAFLLVLAGAVYFAVQSVDTDQPRAASCRHLERSAVVAVN